MMENINALNDSGSGSISGNTMSTTPGSVPLSERRPTTANRRPRSSPVDLETPCPSTNGSNVRDTSSQMSGAGEGIPRTNSAPAEQVTNKVTKDVHGWMDLVPFTRQKKHIHRDFSDGVLMAELIAHFFPKMIELHNYAAANNTALKKNNWDLLNRKILPKLGIKLTDVAIESICLAKPGCVELVLNQIRKLITKKTEEDDMEKARQLALSATRDCGDGPGSSTPLTEGTCLVHIVPDEVPEFVVYGGRKYFMEKMVVERNMLIEELKEKNKELTNKVRRLETLVNLKEKHLEDLTRQLHELRMREGTHECVCQWDEGEEPKYAHFN